MNNFGRKIKICFVSLEAYGLFNKESNLPFGGAGVQNYLLANEMAKDNNFSVSFVVGTGKRSGVEKFNDIQVHVLKNNPHYCKNFWKYFLLIPFIVRLFWKLQEIDADIYIQQAAGFETGIIGLFCHLFKKEFIYLSASRIDVSGEYASWGLKGKIYLFGLKKAAAIVVQNSDDQTMLKKGFGLKSMIIKSFYPLKRETEIMDCKLRKFTLWISSSQQLKKPQLFLKLAKSFPKEKFVMIMPVNDKDLFSKIRKKAARMENVEFIEKVPFDKIRDYYNQAKVFVNTSDFEGFPIAFIESMACKTPLLSLNVNPDNFINEYRCGFFAGGDFKKMKRMFKELTENESLCCKMGENGFYYVRRNHDLETNAEKFKKLFFSHFRH